MSTPQDLTAARRSLGIDCLALQIHDSCFPSDPEEDCGRGSPYSNGATRFYEFAAGLGFNAIQFGPQGMTQRGNPSPYDAAVFSRNPLNLPLSMLVREGRVSQATCEALRVPSQSVSSEHVPYDLIYDRFQIALAEITARADRSDRDAARTFLSEHHSWLVSDAIYQALCIEHQGPWWGAWGHTAQGQFDQRLFHPAPEDEPQAMQRLQLLQAQYSQEIEDYALIQWLLAREHQALRGRLSKLNLLMLADLQVGLSSLDTWARSSLFLDGYRMGAPPSRTNPSGQPWGYPVLDPDQLGTLDAPGPALQFVQARINSVLMNYDGLRIDHPHGWIDPWVYRADDSDPFHAVQHGSRLFSSPHETDHSQLTQYAIPQAEVIDELQPRYGDHRVRSLTEPQVARYSLLLDLIVSSISQRDRQGQAIACEVLSTLPYPIQRVLERHGIGRFRVVQKSKLDDPSDVYRIENARPEDWIMLGTHDTATIWELADQWCQSETGKRWAGYLLSLAVPPITPVAREQQERQIANSPAELIHTLFSAMLTCQARHLSVFFPDLFGLTERYNTPGLVSDNNWNLRLPGNFEELYADRCESHCALDLRKCLLLPLGN